MSGMTLDRLESIVTDGASSDEEVSEVVEFIAVLRKRPQEAENVLSFQSNMKILNSGLLSNRLCRLRTLKISWLLSLGQKAGRSIDEHSQVES